MFEQAFKNIDDILHKDAGCGSELDYVEQTSWVLFLKYLDDLEKDKETAALLSGKNYTRIIEQKYKWTTWAAPKLKSGKIDHNALTGDDLLDFVNQELFPYLEKFKENTTSADTIEYKIGEIFSELKNRIQSGYNLREVVSLIDELRFRTHAEKHEMSHLYEGKIKNMGNAGRNGGEYYTPRPLIKTIVKVVAPKIGETIYDGAVGSAGFLVEAFDYLKNSKQLSTKDVETLQKKTFYGKEKKSLAYIIGIMNMILHGVEAPNIIHTNTLAENLSDIQEKDRYNIVLANPPFGGKERAEVQQNFPIKTGETASLFLQHFIKILKAGGKAGIVIKNTFLSNTDNASVALRKELLTNCNLHTVLDLPGGTFTGAGVKTVVLFFEKGSTTQKTWFYQLNLGRNLGKTNPLNEKDLAEFIELQKTKAESENSWSVNLKDIDQSTFDLSVRKRNHLKLNFGFDMKNEIILYQTDNLTAKVEVRVEDDTIWLTQAQIITLFDSSKANISEHIKHIFQTGELEETATVRNFRTVRKEGNRTVTRELTHYNLDVIISIGYRINSIQGTQFRIWANKILKDYLLKGYSLNNRMNRIEDNVSSLIRKVEGIDLQIQANLPPNQGVFFDRQVFDAYTLMADIVRSAKTSIVLIDNYIDDTVLTHLCKKETNVKVTLLTKTISKQLQLDVKKANTQYPKIEVKTFTKAHDRFLIIDQKEVYHLGASLKDLGKKWFAFSKMDKSSVTIINSILDLI